MKVSGVLCYSVCDIVRNGKCDVGLISWITSIVSSLKMQFCARDNVNTDFKRREKKMYYRDIRTRY